MQDGGREESGQQEISTPSCWHHLVPRSVSWYGHPCLGRAQPSPAPVQTPRQHPHKGDAVTSPAAPSSFKTAACPGFSASQREQGRKSPPPASKTGRLDGQAALGGVLVHTHTHCTQTCTAPHPPSPFTTDAAPSTQHLLCSRSAQAGRDQPRQCPLQILRPGVTQPPCRPPPAPPCLLPSGLRTGGHACPALRETRPAQPDGGVGVTAWGWACRALSPRGPDPPLAQLRSHTPHRGSGRRGLGRVHACPADPAQPPGERGGSRTPDPFPTRDGGSGRDRVVVPAPLPLAPGGLVSPLPPGAPSSSRGREKPIAAGLRDPSGSAQNTPSLARR